MVIIRDSLRKLWNRASGTSMKRLESLIDKVANINILMTTVNFQ